MPDAAVEGLQGRGIKRELELVRIYIAASEALAGGRDPFLACIHATFNDSAEGADPNGTLRSAVTDVQKATLRLQAAMDLTSYRQAFPSFIAALYGQQFLPRAAVVDLQARDDLHNALGVDFMLRDVPDAVAVIRSVVKGMSPVFLQFIGELHACSGLLEFLSSFESLGPTAFLSQAAVVTSQMQGLQQESDVINALVIAEAWLRPFTTRQRPRFFDMAALAQQPPSAQELASRITILRGLVEHLATLKQLFALGQGEGSQELLMKIATDAETQPRFVSRLAGSGASALVLQYLPSLSSSERQELNPELLAEVIRGAALATPTTEQRAGMERFVAAYHAACSVHDQRLFLESLGHPEFSRGEVEVLMQGINVSVTALILHPKFAQFLRVQTQATRLGHRRDELIAMASTWREALAGALFANRRLKLLEPRQLLRFIQALATPTERSVGPFVLLW